MKSSYTIREAVDETGIGEDRIREAIRTNDLPVRYHSARYVILDEDLQAWLHSLPTEPKAG